MVRSLILVIAFAILVVSCERKESVKELVILPIGEIIAGAESAPTISPTDLVPAPSVTKPMWMYLPKSWHRDCKRWIKPIALGTYKYGDPKDHPLMYAAQVRQESRCDPSARSHVGAGGLTQIMPATAGEIQKKWGEGTFDVWDGAANIRAGLWYNQRVRRFWNPKYRSWCDRVMLMWSGYNGGNGWWLKAQRKCEIDTPGKCNGYYHMAPYLPKVNPNGAHENLNYVRLISKSWENMMSGEACGVYDATGVLK